MITLDLSFMYPVAFDWKLFGRGNRWHARSFHGIDMVVFFICMFQLPLDKTQRKTCSKGDCSYSSVKPCIIYWTYFLFLWIISHHGCCWVSWFHHSRRNHYQSNAGNLLLFCFVRAFYFFLAYLFVLFANLLPLSFKFSFMLLIKFYGN